ncbi:MAG: DeoR/GlpR family DNA-binding transcription regulator [Pelagimonas sp.]|jgi:DeoR family glycerol-3-phosphate regulon repressor|nr:DeoR/GlpR family DNA-binding transcription regulator [Pelagimonas sp.]
MTQTLRQLEILNIAERDGKVTVDALAQYFDVTLQTIRRDLTELAETGKLMRVHGGAVLPSGSRNIAYDERRVLNRDAKAEIAKHCAAAVPHGACIFLNIGTTTEAIARELLHHKGLLVVTNNMNVAQIMASNASSDVIVTGGILRASDGGLIGALTIESIRQFKLDLAIMGCSAIDEDGDILDYDSLEVGVSRAILTQSRRAFLVADHSKLNRAAPIRVGNLADFDQVFTDRDFPSDMARKCDLWNTPIFVTGAAPDAKEAPEEAP